MFHSIFLNNKEVKLDNILTNKVFPVTEFESETLNFLKEWLQNAHQFIIQTSGSTGNPKPIFISREQMIQSAQMTIQALTLMPGSTALVCLSTKYIAGRMMLVRALVNNMQIVAVEPSSNPLEKVDPLRSTDFTAFVPLQLQAMLDAGLSSRLNSIKNILIGGAALNESLRRRTVAELTTNVFVTYGMTETITHVALQEVHKETDGNNFFALPGVRLSLDSRGCLVIEAPHLKEPVITNDLAEITSATSFRWIGRFDNVINTGGVKIIPELVTLKIEKILKGQSIAQRFFLAGLLDDRLGEKVVLFIEGEILPDDEEKKLTRKFKESLSAYETPKEITYITKFIETETGKIHLKKTIEQFIKS